MPQRVRSRQLLIVVSTLLAVLAGTWVSAGEDDTARPLKLLRINPSGEDVRPGNQIVFQFDRAVVPLGRMDRRADEIPITIAPDPGCHWRWINTSTLACNLDGDDRLRTATGYRITVHSTFEAEDGGRPAEEIEHSFVTQRPRVAHFWFETWESPGTPVIRLTFNQEIERESLAEHLEFRFGPGGRIAAVVEPTGEERRYWFVKPERELPPDSYVSLAILPGVMPLQGDEPGVERRSVVAFHTIPPYRFMGLQCWSNGGARVRIHPGEMQRGDRRCNPLEQISLVFSSPVRVDALREHLAVDPDLAGGREDYDPWEGYPEYSRLSRYRPDDGYHFWLPEILQADREYRITAGGGDLVDEFGRELEADIDFRFRTDDRKPNLKITHTTSTLESEVETHLPVVVTNLERITANFSTLTADGRSGDLDGEVKVPEAKNVAFRHPLPVRDWLGGKPGAVAGRLNSDPVVHRHPRWFFSTVSSYQVHVKLGHYNTLVWVTDLVTGRPVRGARVEVSDRLLEDMKEIVAVKAAGKTNRHGTAVLPGAESLDPKRTLVRYWSREHGGTLFVTVSKGDDMAVMPLIRGFRIDNRGQGGSWISTDNRARHGHIRTWGTTAQGIYRAGDTVEYKIWVRDDRNERLEPAPKGKYLLKVIDPTGKTTHERKEIELNEFGAFHGEFTVPETAAVGWYGFRLSSDYAGGLTWDPLSVLVSDFTPAPFRVQGVLNGERFRDGEEVEVETSASLHSGGPYADARSRVTAVVAPLPFRPDDPAASGFRFDTGEAQAETIHQGEASLDGEGKQVTRFPARSGNIIHGSLTVESAVRDDRGKYIVGRATAKFTARDRFVGIRQDDWVLQAGKEAVLLALVTDESGKPAAGSKIVFTIEQRKTTASRVKGAGNAYLTEYTHSWEAIHRCQEESTVEPASCNFTPAGPGSYRLTVEAQDTRGRPVRSTAHRWAAGRGAVLWESPPGHDLSIVPEKTSLRVGDRARYLVKNPYPGARALVTVERYGVIKSWMEVLKDSTAIVEFPVEPDFLPGYHLSITVMSPRVESAPEDGQVDLGKPAFRTGYVKVEVRDPYKELEIEASSDRETYRPGDTVNLEIGARTRQGDVPGMEYAVVVLDEAVLDLIAGGTARFDPYAGFYSLRSLDVLNFNILKNLIGIQKFDRKGANPGGGGGGPDARMRSNFRFVGYWNPSVRPDRKGRAKVSFEVPDNLTGWRVLVLASTAGDRFGLGQERFTVNRPTEIRPALPNQVVEGDRFEARFTVMNRTENRRTLAVSGTVDGSVKGEPVLEQTVEAEPYKRRIVSVPVTSRGPGEIRFRIRAGDDSDADGLVAKVPVNRMVAVESAATYGSTVERSVAEPVKFPEKIRTDVGGLSLTAGPTVISGLEGAFGYMRDYPYICWEQKLSKAVMAAHFIGLRRYLDRSLEWPGAAALVERTLELAANHQTPQGGMAYYVPRDRYTSPYLSAYTALAFRWLREQGYEIPSGVEERLHEYLLGMLRRDAYPGFYSRGMASTVRAVALAALAPAGKISRTDLERYRRHLPQMDLFGRAHFLQAALRLGAEPEMLAQATDSILSHADETGGKLSFVEDLDNGFTRLLHSSTRTQCAVLEALTGHEDDHLREISYKLVRSVVQTRGRRYHWENTQENLFCTRAMISYSRRFEQVEPDFTLRAGIDGEPMGEASFRDFRQEPVLFDRPMQENDPGSRKEVTLDKEGPGRLYYALRLAYSPVDPPVNRINAGIDARREYSVERDGSWDLVNSPVELEQGELVRVDLYLHLPAPRNFVVVDDPVPGGLEPVNRDLATASTVDADKAVNAYPPDAFYFTWSDWRSYGYTRWSFYHRELRHDSVRFYSDYLPAGRYHLSYVAQVIATGEFSILPLHAGEMYDTDVYGRGAAGILRVRPSEE